MESKSSMKDKIKDFLWLTLGTLMVTIGVYFLSSPIISLPAAYRVSR